MKQSRKYPMGNAMTVPFHESCWLDDRRRGLDYVLPVRLWPLAEMVKRVCDGMDYEGSMMHDRCPDKVTIERLARAICREYEQRMDGRTNDLLEPLIEVMLGYEFLKRMR